MQDLPFKVYSSIFLKGTLWKGHFERKMGWKHQESKILPSKEHYSRFQKGNFKRKRKQESNIYHPKFIFTSAVPGQVRKTIDRIFPGEMKTNHLLQNFLGKHVCIFGGLPPRPYLSAFWQETLKAKSDEKKQKSKIYPLKTISGRLWKGNFERKEG
jgi:hypothetical protein